MSRNLFALLIAINHYPRPVPSLSGCVNDIEAFETYLRNRLTGDAFDLHLRVLKNEEATRAAIIAGFREHLQQAKAGDTVLFYYSGHGSQEQAPPEFWHLEPDHLNETLVCYDSRTPGGWDLADKELAYLLAETAKNGPHITIILDCCHSGSGTRAARMETDIRWIPADERIRPLDTFLFSPTDLPQQATLNREANPSGWLTLPEGRHVLLAACRDDQLAKEFRAEGNTWGTFSYFLRTTLEGTQGPLTYRELFKATQARVQTQVFNQVPQLEATRPADFDLPFLGGAIALHPQYFTASYGPQGWRLDAGAVHGFPHPTWGETTELALFSLDTPAEALRHLEKALGIAEIAEVFPQTSSLRFQEWVPDQGKTYKAIVTSLPMPPMGMQLTGDPNGIAAVRTALATSATGGKPSLYIREVDAMAQLRLIAEDNSYLITRPADDRPLTSRIEGYQPNSATQAVQRLEHIARWHKTADLTNPGTQLPADAVVMRILKDGEEISFDKLIFTYPAPDQKPSCVVKLKNQIHETLYCSVLGLWENFGIEVIISQQPVVRLEPGQEFSRQIWLSVPDEVWKMGIVERKDILKLIVCTDEFDATLLTQGKLDAPQRRATRGPINPRKNTLTRLMQHIQTRESSDQPEGTHADWTTSQVVMTIRRPLDTKPVPRQGEVTLNSGVTLEAHPTLTGGVRVSSLPLIQRDLFAPRLPALLQETSPEGQPFQLQVTRGMEWNNVLEFTQVKDYKVVTPENPLRLNLQTRLYPGEHILAYGFDGEFFLPLGIARPQNGQTQITLEQLPPPTTYGTRDLRGSIRILFHKVVSRPLNIPYPYPILAAATVNKYGEVSYEANPERVRERVAVAQTITLYVHGFTGDTRGMAASAPHTHSDNLLLTFDYESIGTVVEKTARELRERLEAVGLKPGHGKQLRIIAHSLGGLVSRWFIEREGGAEIATELVILGSPSDGTPWPTVKEWAMLCIGVALNGLSTVAWPLKVLAWLLNLSEAVDDNLSRIQPGSDFLQTLNASPDPGIPYTLIAGSTSLIAEALEGGDKSAIAKLLTRLGYQLVSLPFFLEANDLVISVKSVHNVPKERTPSPVTRIIPTDHMSYFDTEVGQTAIRKALNK